MLCLIASAREPVTKEQMAARLYWPDDPLLRKAHEGSPESKSASYWIERTINYLLPMLRSGHSGKHEPGYTLYHHTLRQHLEEDSEVQETFHIQRDWLVEKQCTQIPLEKAGAFAGYVREKALHTYWSASPRSRRPWISWIIERAEAILMTICLRVAIFRLLRRKVCLKLENWVQELSSRQLSSDELESRKNMAKKIKPTALVNAIERYLRNRTL